MDLTNRSYVIQLKSRNSTERYQKDEVGWFKISSRGRAFRMSAEQVLNHILPVLTGVKQNMTIEVKHQDDTANG